MPNPNFPNNPIQWNSANSYEPLTIVSNEGNSYTSKTFVPSGIDISNETYWALTGNFNAQVEQYRSGVMNYAQQSQMYFDLTSVALRRLKGKKILIVGASNEELNIPSSSYGPTWAEQFMNMLNGIADVTVNAVGGRTLTGPSGGAATVIANLSGNYDYIIIATSRNDFYSNVSVGPMFFSDGANYNDISHSLFSINAEIINYPNTEVYMMGMFNGPIDPNSYYNWTAFQEAIFSRCKRYGIGFIDCADWVGNYSFSQVTTYAPDGRHFLPQYSLRIAEKLIGYLIHPTSYYSPSITETVYHANEFVNVADNVVMGDCIMRTFGSLMTMTVVLQTTNNIPEGTILAQMNLGSFDPASFTSSGDIDRKSVV